jgi:hypothetical protein
MEDPCALCGSVPPRWREQRTDPYGYTHSANQEQVAATKPDLMLTVREMVLAVVTHLQAAPAAAARPVAALHLPMLCRFAAGDGVSTDDLHRALFNVQDEALKAFDHALCEKATWAANYALLGCSAGHRDMIQRSIHRHYGELRLAGDGAGPDDD